MEYLLYALFFLSCIVLVGSVLLQPGKTDAGALFTSNISSSAFAPRGTQTVLSKITIGAATVFMLSALMLSMPALRGNKSVLSSVPEPAAEDTAPATEQTGPSPAGAGAPASSPASADANTSKVEAEKPSDTKTDSKSGSNNAETKK